MSSFEFTLPTRVVFGPGAVDEVGSEAAGLGQNALLVTGSTFARRSGLIDRIRASMTDAGTSVTVLDSLEQNPTVSAIDAGGKLAREVGADVVVGLGGGSALDAAKAIAAAAMAADSIWDYTHPATNGQPNELSGALPLVQVPIIASTGSETNGTSVLLDDTQGRRVPITSRHLYARVAIVDPTLAFTVPARYTAVGAMNIVSQMLEGYLTSDAFAVTDRLAEGLMRVVMDSLHRAMRSGDDLEARTNLAWAATMASTVALAGRGGNTPLRSLAYPVTARFGIEHGVALAGLWPAFMRYALSNRLRLPQIGRFKRYALLGRQLFGVHETDDEVAAEMTTYRFTGWLQNSNMPSNLEHVEATSDDVSAIARQAIVVSGKGGRLPSGLSMEDVENIYQAAFRPEQV